jgi:hypothetical protein
MPAVLSSPLARTRVSSHKFFAHPTTCRSILAFLAPRRSAQTRRHASPCAIAPPLAARSHSRGTLAAQIPIAEPAARPTERTSGDFVPWRFSDAGHRSAWLDHRCRRPKTCTEAVIPTSSIQNRQHSHRRFRVSNFAQKPPSERARLSNTRRYRSAEHPGGIRGPGMAELSQTT